MNAIQTALGATGLGQTQTERAGSVVKAIPVIRSEVHALVADLRAHRAWVYWPDFLASATVFWAGLLLASHTPSWVAMLGCTLAASLALYRAALFSHEVGHFGKNTLPGFAWAWNALCGVPIFFPSFMLKSHVDHHGVSSYGTARDPEYLPFAAYPQLKRWFWLGSALTPWIFALRALVLVPAAWLHPGARVWLRARMSYMAMNGVYRANSDFQQLTVGDRAMEAATCVWAYGLGFALTTGVLPWRFAVLLFACMTTANVLNAWRTLHAHRYQSAGQNMSAREQLLDSVTFALPAWLGELAAPVGQRFHAAHHLFPYLPYHALAQAHQRVLASDWAGVADYKKTCQ
jgi:fatty acid desaturase